VIISTHDRIELARIDGTDPTCGARRQLRLADGSLLLEGVYLYLIRRMVGTESVVQKFLVIP
jgi:hypothetical protein